MLKHYAVLIATLLTTITLPAGAQDAPQVAEAVDAEEEKAEEGPDPEEVLAKAHAWVLDFIVRAAPPGRKIYYPDGQETEEEALERYEEIAWDIVELAYSKDTVPVFKSQTHGRSQMAVVWMGIMLNESGFMKHVDYNLGPHGRGDSGLSWCMMQMRIGKGTTAAWNTKENRQPWYGDPEEDIFQGYTGPELIEDRKKCISEAHHLVRLSFKSAEKAGLPVLEWLTAYTIGKSKVTDPDDPDDVEYVRVGKQKSRTRMGSGIKYFAATKFARGFRDQEVVEALEARAREAENPDISFVSQGEVKGPDLEWKTSSPYPAASVPQLSVATPLPMPLAMPEPLEVRELRSRPPSFSTSATQPSLRVPPSLLAPLRHPLLGLLMLNPSKPPLLPQTTEDQWAKMDRMTLAAAP